jgi:hypothetical protein
MKIRSKECKPKKASVWVTTDSEFQLPVWVCNQHYFVGADGVGKVGLYFTDRVPQHVRELWQVYVRDNKIDCHIEYVADGTPTIPLFRARHGLEDANVSVVNYFSPKDLEFAFG